MGKRVRGKGGGGGWGRLWGYEENSERGSTLK